MTGSEFAAVVATMPIGDQEAIGAMAREMLEERTIRKRNRQRITAHARRLRR